jgi:hypothetical protein
MESIGLHSEVIFFGWFDALCLFYLFDLLLNVFFSRIKKELAELSILCYTLLLEKICFLSNERVPQKTAIWVKTDFFFIFLFLW